MVWFEGLKSEGIAFFKRKLALATISQYDSNKHGKIVEYNITDNTCTLRETCDFVFNERKRENIHIYVIVMVDKGCKRLYF